MSEKIAEPIQYIIKSEIGGVLSKAFAQLYRTKPNFPVTYLAEWLKQYCTNNHNQQLKVETVNKNLSQFNKIQQHQKKLAAETEYKKLKHAQQHQLSEKQFHDTISFNEYLEDLLEKWLPNFIQNKYHLSGAYIGYLTHPYRAIPSSNFEPGAELDTQSPKVIQYIGTSDNQKSIMYMKILPNEKGISFDCFNQPEPQPQQAQPAEGQEPKPAKQPKKTYIYVPDVTKNEKIHYFKFPKLGSYCCFPLKLKNYLIQASFDQSVSQHKQFVKQKQQAQKQYNDKHNELKAQYEEAKKKFDELQVPEEEASPQQVADKKNLQEQAKRLHEALIQFEKNPPKVSQPKFTCIQKCYLLGIDTLGQDKQIPQNVLDQIDKNMLFFRKQFENKQKAMLLQDILAYIQEQSKLDAIEVIYRQHQKNALSQAEQQAKQKNIKDKQLQFEIAAVKAKKMDSLFQDPNIDKSMRTYFNYNTPKYKEIIQIALMLLGYKLAEINLPRKNVLNFRKIKQPKFIEEFMSKIQQFNLKPVGAESCPQQYKITKLLQRLQKIDLQQVGRYNGYLWALANHIKSYCWALILCRDAKKQAYQISVKLKEDRAAQIDKYKQQRQKAMEAAKAELGEENQASFNQQEWITSFAAENPEPQPLQLIKLQEYHNID